MKTVLVIVVLAALTACAGPRKGTPNAALQRDGDGAQFQANVRQDPAWDNWTNMEWETSADIRGELAAVTNAATFAEFRGRWYAYELARRQDERPFNRLTRRIVRRILRAMSGQQGEEP